MTILQIKDIFPNIPVARYNLAVWQKPDGDSLFFIGREVAQAGAEGEPDTGVLKLFEVAKDGRILKEKTIWTPLYNGINLEDPRVLLDDEDLVVGLTAVLRDKNGIPVPFPAIVKINSLSSWSHELPPFLVIDTFGPGKNLTPIDKHTFLFRPESPEYYHKIMVFSLHAQVPEKLGDIEFPTDLSWASWRIGTTMPPIWLTPDEALFIIHGISKRIVDGVELYIYSIGRAKLVRTGSSYKVTVAPEPILTPDNFLGSQGLPLVRELHPEQRRVVYSCGGVINKHTPDLLSLYVNVGDRTTFEVTLLMEELKKDLF